MLSNIRHMDGAARSHVSEPRKLTQDQHERLARVAEMYYESGLGQSEIAARLGYSRSMISRLISEARAKGVVEIRINHPVRRRLDIESALKARFALDHVRVLAHNTDSYATMLRRMGVLAAGLLGELVTDHMTIGVSWGATLADTIAALPPSPRRGVRVVQIIGSLGARKPENDGPELTRKLARALGGDFETMPAPLVVDNKRMRDLLLSDSRIKQVIAAARHADLLVLGIGSVDPEYSSLLREGFIRQDQLTELVKRGAVGDFCALHFDADGRFMDSDIARRTVGIDFDSAKAVPQRLGIAGGAAKSRTILGALRGGLITSLVTDEIAASDVLAAATSDI